MVKPLTIPRVYLSLSWSLAYPIAVNYKRVSSFTASGQRHGIVEIALDFESKYLGLVSVLCHFCGLHLFLYIFFKNIQKLY